MDFEKLYFFQADLLSFEHLETFSADQVRSQQKCVPDRFNRFYLNLIQTNKYIIPEVTLNIYKNTIFIPLSR